MRSSDAGGVCGWRTLRHVLLTAGITLAGLLGVAGTAVGDVAPIAGSTELTWPSGVHETPIELLGGVIASRIAGRPVTVRCESETDWELQVLRRGGDSVAEVGHVGSSWNGGSGQLVGISNVIELDGNDVCVPLRDFAAAATKPTKCLVAAPAAFVPPRLVRVRRTVVVGGKTRVKFVLVRRPVSHLVQQRLQAKRPGPCYLGDGRTARQMPASFWSDYERYAAAIVTLAHESIHAGGVVGGRLPGGLAVGDPQAEAKAECYGMQWVRAIAVSLGDSPDDAQAIASYFWDTVYPRGKASADPAYWSADCRPQGPLAISVPDGSTAWP